MLNATQTIQTDRKRQDNRLQSARLGNRPSRFKGRGVAGTPHAPRPHDIESGDIAYMRVFCPAARWLPGKRDVRAKRSQSRSRHRTRQHPVEYQLYSWRSLYRRAGYCRSELDRPAMPALERDVYAAALLEAKASGSTLPSAASVRMGGASWEAVKFNIRLPGNRTASLGAFWEVQLLGPGPAVTSGTLK
jgi:hypothetical protein